MEENTIVAFHIGRGGRFNNPGFKTFIGVKKIGEFTDDLFGTFENTTEFKDRFGYDNTYGEDQKCILDLITDENLYELEEKFGITPEMLGDYVYFDGGGNPVGLTQKEVDYGIGGINIDNEYNTTYTCKLSDCSEEELELIRESREFDWMDANFQEYVNAKLSILKT